MSMLQRFIQLLFGVFGGMLGYQLHRVTDTPSGWVQEITGSGSSVNMYLFVGLGAAILFVGSSWMAKGIVAWIHGMEEKLVKLPLTDLLVGCTGLIMGLIIAALVFPSLRELQGYGIWVSMLVTLVLAYSGQRIAYYKKDEFIRLMEGFRFSGERRKETKMFEEHKILDTSVIIDGRIADICKTGFIEGTLVIPEFVLEELQHIADSSDLLKRNRGRRGLDILNKIQKELDVHVLIYEGDFEDITEVDSKLVKLAKVLQGKVVTNDFNLNKVCELQGVSVLNINDLANAVKPVVLPGEEILVQVIKDGKEFGQGVAYLDDGTMIVVEGGRDFIGATIEVLVTSVLQTSAGRMIFAKPKLLEKAL
jgi:uncharacterized protein YacL